MTQYRNGSWVAASGLAPVANAMHAWCREWRCDFATMLGDNIYPKGATLGADGNDDAARFEKIFREPFARYSDLGADFRIYAALGNHDWKTSRAGAMAQVDYLTRTAPFYVDGIVRVRPLRRAPSSCSSSIPRSCWRARRCSKTTSPTMQASFGRHGAKNPTDG
jgi:hypothetical protein